VPPEQTFTSKRLQECNWLQAMEGGIDSSHVSFLHSGSLNTDPLFKGSKGNQYNLKDMKPVFEVVEQPAASTSARAATPRRATTTGASRPG
jgi:phenylpropionate dioxygenase-like ring-hydroxylating dioxygenase large terminal subunit